MEGSQVALEYSPASSLQLFGPGLEFGLKFGMISVGTLKVADRKKPRPVSGFFHSTPKVAAFGAEMTATPDYIPSDTIVTQMGHKFTAIGYCIQGWLRDPGSVHAPGLMAEPLLSMRSKERGMPLELSWGVVISITFVVALLMVAVSAHIAYHKNGV